MEFKQIRIGCSAVPGFDESKYECWEHSTCVLSSHVPYTWPIAHIQIYKTQMQNTHTYTYSIHEGFVLGIFEPSVTRSLQMVL